MCVAVHGVGVGEGVTTQDCILQIIRMEILIL